MFASHRGSLSLTKTVELVQLSGSTAISANASAMQRSNVSGLFSILASEEMSD